MNEIEIGKKTLDISLRYFSIKKTTFKMGIKPKDTYHAHKHTLNKKELKNPQTKFKQF